MTRQVVFERAGVDDRVSELVALSLVKKGGGAASGVTINDAFETVQVELMHPTQNGFFGARDVGCPGGGWFAERRSCREPGDARGCVDAGLARRGVANPPRCGSKCPGRVEPSFSPFSMSGQRHVLTVLPRRGYPWLKFWFSMGSTSNEICWRQIDTKTEPFLAD